jgi:hypothetical protein
MLFTWRTRDFTPTASHGSSAHALREDHTHTHTHNTHTQEEDLQEECGRAQEKAEEGPHFILVGRLEVILGALHIHGVCVCVCVCVIRVCVCVIRMRVCVCT